MSRSGSGPKPARRRAGLGVVWLLVLVAGSAAAAETVRIAPDRDNTLFQDADGDTSNGSGPALFSGNNAQDRSRRALLRFDIAGHLPAGARIESVTLTVTVSNTPNETWRSFTVHRVLDDWGEGASYATGGSGAPAAPGDATWLDRFFPGSPWSAAGGDFAGVASAAQTIGGIGSWSWSGPGMLEDVRTWLSDPATNFGWLIRGEEGEPSTVRRFDSREAAAAGTPPELAITWSPATGAVEVDPPDGGRLGPCRPNPTRGPIGLAITLAGRAVVRVSVHDPGGRERARLLDRELEAGVHELAWSGLDARGRALGPGVYLCVAIANGRPLAARRFVVVQ